MKISLIADQAIGESDARTDDGLGFDAYSRVLAAAATDTRGPFTIGVFGDWGTGKTSLMRLIESRLASDPRIVTVWFNAWRYEKEEHPIVPLVGTIIQELERHQSLKRNLGDTGKSLIRALRAIAYGFSAKSKVKVPGFAEVEASFVAKDMIDRDERQKTDPLLDRSLYYGAFNSLDTVQLKDELRVVILIDDLDRCFPDQAIRLLESIKLVLAQPGFIFVLGVARRVVEGYLQHRYTAEYGISDFKGQLYLDKIVQLPFHLPPSKGRMATFSKSLLHGQPSEVIEGLEPVMPVVAEALGGNPRAIIRFINNILIDTAISSEVVGSDSEELIPVQYFAISRCLENRWPDVFTSLTASDEVAADVARWNREDFARYSRGDDEIARVAAALLSDRALESLLLGPQGKDWLVNSHLRHASVGFLITEQRLSELDAVEIGTRWDLFIIYNHADRDEVVEIVRLLSEYGSRAFFDTAVTKPSVEIISRSMAALNSSAAVAYCMGPGSSKSDLKEQELALALNAGKTVIPILLPGADPDDLPLQLAERQLLDFREGITKEAVRVLAFTIRRHSR
jgi:hypothetical protein